MEVRQEGLPKQLVMTANRPQGFLLSPTRALVFERRVGEAKAYVSHVTATKGSEVQKRLVSVNDPFTFAGWTLYQVNYNADDPTYSGLEAVYDPGVAWVFTGFALISIGVFYMFYVEPRLKRSKKAPAAASAAQA
jgi:cytochrome c biogenesis protein ResB